MKVVFINSLYYPRELGGAEKAVRAIAEEHAKSGGDSVVICQSEDNTTKIYVHNGVKIYSIPLRNIGNLHGGKPLSKFKKLIWYILDSCNPFMYKKLYDILKEENPDVLECNNLQGFSVIAWAVAKKLNIPVVQVLHDYYLSCVNSTMHTKAKNCSGQCLHCKILCTPRRCLADIPSVISSVSRRTYAKIHGTGMFPPTAQVTYCSSAIKVEKQEGVPASAKHRANTPVVLGFLGRIDPLKGIDVLLEAMTKMPEGKARLFIAGSGNQDYVAMLKKNYESPAIEFLGYTSPKDFFEKIHLLVVPSVWEDPLPRVIAEGQAAGVLVAVSRNGGMTEIVEEGVTGYHFNPGQPEEILKLVDKLYPIDFPSHEQIAKCMAQVEQYSLENVMNHHRKIWDMAIQKKNSTKS